MSNSLHDKYTGYARLLENAISEAIYKFEVVTGIKVDTIDIIRIDDTKYCGPEAPEVNRPFLDITFKIK